jgi:hypothetical protein
MNSDRNFFYELSERIRLLLSSTFESLDRDWFSFTKKVPVLVLSGPGQEVSRADLQLQFLGFEVLGESDGTFSTSDDEYSVLVYKMPTRVLVHYLLSFSEMDYKEGLRIFDGLSASFFNKKTIEAFVPENFKKTPQLYFKMNSVPGELSLVKAGTSSNGKNYQMNFSYKGLYHSGDPIRSEKRVRTRTIDINKTERGVL